MTALIAGHHRELGGGTAGDHPVDAGVDGAVNEATQGAGVDPSVLGERGSRAVSTPLSLVMLCLGYLQPGVDVPRG